MAEIKGTTAISLYLEVDFHDNALIAKWIIDNVKPIGEAICKGVCNYYGVTYKPESGTTPKPPPTGKLFRVQIGAFSVKANANKRVQEAKNKGFSDAFIPPQSGGLFRVQIGAFSVKANANKCLQEAKIKGFSDAFIVES